MARHKIDGLKTAAALLPPALLLAWLSGLPLPLPAPLLPERRYIALARETGSPEEAVTVAAAASLAAARGRAREAFVVLADGLLPLPAADAPTAAWLEAAERLPGAPVIAPLLKDLASGISGAWRLRLITARPLALSEMEDLDAAARKAGFPLVVEELGVEELGSGTSIDFPLGALSYRRARAAERIPFELLFTRAARDAGRIEVSIPVAAGNPEMLWAGAGADLPADLVLRLQARFGPAPAGAAGGTVRTGSLGISVRLRGADGSWSERILDLGAEAEEEPRVLILTDKVASRSFVEELYPARRQSPASAAAEGTDLNAFELVVVDGVPLASLPATLAEGLATAAERRTTSLLFAADSPEFGKRGDAPRLEALLPVSLIPRSLKDLPDLAVLILIDSSGSMFGDKLSLAKVTGLELLRNLKPSDRVGMILFSDEFRWIYDFPVNAGIRAAPTLEPVSAKGGTDLAAALSAGLDRVASLPIKERHAVIVSDGVTKPADFRALAERARSLGMTISTMGVGKDQDRPLLERLALQAGGRYYAVESVDAIPSLLFEDRKSAARPPFIQGSIPIVALNGKPLATISGMALYAPAEPASIILANEYGDPLLASRERGNRAVMVFSSDLYGAYTGRLFANAEAAGAIRDRLDALFTEKPLELAILEGASGATVILRSDSLAAPSLLLSRTGAPDTESPFRRSGPDSWAALAVASEFGRWRASVLDRGASLASFDLALNGGFLAAEAGTIAGSAAGTAAGTVAGTAAGFRVRGSGFFRVVRADLVWLLAFFAASLGATLVLRVKR